MIIFFIWKIYNFPNGRKVGNAGGMGVERVIWTAITQFHMVAPNDVTGLLFTTKCMSTRLRDVQYTLLVAADGGCLHVVKHALGWKWNFKVVRIWWHLMGSKQGQIFMAMLIYHFAYPIIFMGNIISFVLVLL